MGVTLPRASAAEGPSALDPAPSKRAASTGRATASRSTTRATASQSTTRATASQSSARATALRSSARATASCSTTRATASQSTTASHKRHRAEKGSLDPATSRAAPAAPDRLRPLAVSVIGASDPTPIERDAAERAGELLARAGALVVCGGLGGVMEAACRGAKRAGGTTVGILPGDRPEDANPYVDVAVPTGLREARNALVVRAGDGALAIGGGTGTLSEIGLALKLGRVVVGVHTWEVSKDGHVPEGFLRARSAEEAVALLLEHLASLP
jgi:uncharacterized protein (TIGR00725 family)